MLHSGDRRASPEAPQTRWGRTPEARIPSELPKVVEWNPFCTVRLPRMSGAEGKTPTATTAPLSTQTRAFSSGTSLIDVPMWTSQHRTGRLTA